MLRYKYLLALGAASLILAACASGGASVAPTSPPTSALAATAAPTPAVVLPKYTVQRGEMDDVLTLDGRVAPLIDQDLFFPQAGALVQVHVEIGDSVTKGQLLAELDHRELDDKLGDAQRNYEAIAHKLAGDKADRQISIKTAQLSLEDAQAKVTKLQQPPSRQDLSKARVAVDQAKINLSTTQRNASLAKTQAEAAVAKAADELRARQEEYGRIVAQNGDRGEQDKAQRAMDEAERNLVLAQASYDAAVRSEIDSIKLAEHEVTAAQIALDQLRAGPDRLDLAQAKRDVVRAQLALESLNTTDDTLSTQQQAEQAQREVEKQRQAIEEAKIYAPFDGMIAETIARPGDKLEQFAPVLTIIDPAEVDLVVGDVTSDDLAKIGVGQPAEITFLAASGQIISGTVSKLPEDTGDSQSSSTVRIEFEKGGLDLEIGDPASVRMVLQHVPDALWLPAEALRERDQRRYVLVPDGDRQREVDVKVGIVTAERVQILSGLKEGDVVFGPAPVK